MKTYNDMGNLWMFIGLLALSRKAESRAGE